MSFTPTQHELSSLTAACQRLWQLDTNALQPGQDYQINPQVSLFPETANRQTLTKNANNVFVCLQQGKKSYMDQDMAPELLFAYVNPAVFQQRSTYSLFYALLDNYHA